MSAADYAEFQLEPGERLVLTWPYIMEFSENRLGEESRYVSDPGFPEDDQAPDPYFEGLTGDQVIAELFRLEQEEWMEQQRYHELYQQMYWNGEL